MKIERITDRVYMALLHYPIYNKEREVVATALTNLDIHDIARLAITYGIKRYFVVSPLELQKKLARQLVRHWVEGKGAGYNLSRKLALERVKIVDNLDEAKEEIKKDSGISPKVIATTARRFDISISFERLRELLENEGFSWLLAFGTGYGLTDEFIRSVDFVLEPIYGVNGYNHLSVRCAAAIVLDRLFRVDSINNNLTK